MYSCMYGSCEVPKANVARAYRGGAVPPQARNGRTSVLLGRRRSIPTLSTISVCDRKLVQCVIPAIKARISAHMSTVPEGCARSLPSAVAGQVHLLRLVEKVEGVGHLLVRQAGPDVLVRRTHGGLGDLADAITRLSWEESGHAVSRNLGGCGQRSKERQNEGSLSPHFQRRDGLGKRKCLCV